MISKSAFMSILYFHKNLLMAKTGMDGMEVLERKKNPGFSVRAVTSLRVSNDRLAVWNLLIKNEWIGEENKKWLHDNSSGWRLQGLRKGGSR